MKGGSLVPMANQVRRIVDPPRIGAKLVSRDAQLLGQMLHIVLLDRQAAQHIEALPDVRIARRRRENIFDDQARQHKNFALLIGAVDA